MTVFTKRHHQMFAVARELSKHSNHEQFHHGAVISVGGSMIASGFNNQKSHPLQKKYNAFRNFLGTNTINHSLHAEIHALSRCIHEDLSRAEIFVYRLTRSGVKGLSKPCEACRAALKDFGVRHIFYSTVEGFAYEQI